MKIRIYKKGRGMLLLIGDNAMLALDRDGKHDLKVFELWNEREAMKALRKTGWKWQHTYTLTLQNPFGNLMGMHLMPVPEGLMEQMLAEGQRLFEQGERDEVLEADEVDG